MEWYLPLQKAAASLFILLMGILLLFWCLPEGYVFRDILHRVCGRWICWAGLDNYWALFAPQPVSRNFLLSFELEFADGRLLAWKLPEFTLRPDGYQATPHLRYVKMHNQWLSQQDPAPKVAICHYVLRRFQIQHPDMPAPVRIHILRFYEPENQAIRADFPWLSERGFTCDLQMMNDE